MTLAACFVALILTGGCSDGADIAPADVAKTAAATRMPNLVIITLDTTRADALSAYGQSRKTSPAFDRMAEEGVLFNAAMASSPETLPSHATIFTGK
ncbi:MAG: arylsulfatase A-like enzyme, partial [Myxococcota bacterium]